MSKKYNGKRSGKKARGVGNMSLSKHRKSGGRKSGYMSRWHRELVCKRLAAIRRRAQRTIAMVDSVMELMKKRK